MSNQQGKTTAEVYPFPEASADDRRAVHQQEITVGTGSEMLAPKTLGQALEWARVLYGSSLVPSSYKSAADVLVCMLFGAELGMSAVQSLQNVAVVNGKASLYGDAPLGLVYARTSAGKSHAGQLEEFKETWDPTLAGGTATTTVKRRGAEAITRTFSMDEAKQIDTKEFGQSIKLAEKGTYKNYPRRMCKFKARHEALRDAFPDILLGIIGADEAEEITFRPGVDLDGEIVARDGVKLETLEELVSKMDFETQKAIVGGFDTLNMSRAERLVKLREYKGQDVKLIDWLKDEYAKVKTRGLPRARPAEGVVERMTNDGSIGTGPDRNATPTEVHPADAGQPVTSSTTVEKVERAAVKTSNKAAGSVLF